MVMHSIVFLLCYQATDQSFVDKLNSNLTKNQYFHKNPQTNKPMFGVSHYAGKVTYDASGWLEKNRDTLPAGIMEILQQSSNVLVKTVFRGRRHAHL
jgi:myosin-3